MKIATFNIDWARKYKSENHYLKIEDYLNQQDFDFLVLTETINLNLKKFNFKYFSEQIPENIEFEKLNYSKYLNGEKAYRVAIYSKIEHRKKFEVTDEKTSVALEFKTEFGNLVIYATIIGTRFRENPFAKKELENCINDCHYIFNENENLVIVGDLNTSFNKDEKDFTINSITTQSLENLFENLNLSNATENINKNIDHIIIPKKFEENLVESQIFLKKGELSDHKGIFITLNSKLKKC